LLSVFDVSKHPCVCSENTINLTGALMFRPIDPLLSAISEKGTKCIHFVDIENLLGTGQITSGEVQMVSREYQAQTQARESDLVFIAAGPRNRMATLSGWNWGHTFYQFQKGKDGADVALVNLFNSIQTLDGFHEIYIASGDHSLEPIANRARVCGSKVTIVTGKGKISYVFRSFPHISLNPQAI
jgi:hypothetical protein